MAKQSCKKQIEALLKKKGKMYPSEIAEKLKRPYLSVLKELNALEADGLVVQR